MIYKIKFVKGSDNMTEKISEYYVLYCYDDGTYMSSFNYWTEEISNYHKCRYTNGSVEGRNNKIKTLIRRSYFLPNRMIYENRILLECNERFFIDELSVKNQFWC